MRYEERQKKKQSQSFLEKKKKQRNSIIIVVSVFLFFSLIIGYRIYDYRQENAPYATVGDMSLTKPQYYYFYNMMISNFQTEYESYLPYMQLNLEEDLSKQMLTEDESWEEYFMVNTDMALYEMLLLYQQAQEENYEKDTIENSVKEAVESMELFAATNDMTAEQYIKRMFHEDLTMEKFEDCLRIYITSNKYSNHILNGFETTEQEYEDYYNSNSEKLDLVSYYQIAVKEENYKTSKEKAENMLAEIEKEKTLDAFIAQAEEYQGNNGYNQNTFDGIGTPAEWLMSAENGTYKLIEDEGNEQVLLVYKENREKDISPTVNMRHILLSIPEEETDETSYYTMIQEIEKEWKEKGTSEAFADLVSEYSDDTASVSTGGLYENVSKGEMDTIINEWLFMENRQAGDSAILRSSYGFHLVLFEGNGMEEYKKDSQKAITTEKFNSYVEELKKETLYVKKG